MPFQKRFVTVLQQLLDIEGKIYEICLRTQGVYFSVRACCKFLVTEGAILYAGFGLTSTRSPALSPYRPIALWTNIFLVV
jgi:hypothetical protein